LTGDGGDKVLPNLRPTAVADADGAVRQLLRCHRIVPLEQVSALTGVGEVDIVLELRDRLAAYPEECWADRHVHFEICERAFKWLFEGEDRNRGFFWSTTPFYAPPFFRAAMRCGDHHKDYRGLYRDFLLELSPAAAAVEYAGVGAPIDSAAFRIAVKAAALLADSMHARPATVAPRPALAAVAGVAAADGLRQQIARAGAFTDHFDRDRLAGFLDSPAAALPGAVEMLFTLTSLIEDLAAGSGETAGSDQCVDGAAADMRGGAPAKGATQASG